MSAASSTSQPTTALPPPVTRARQVKVTRYRNGQPISSTTDGPPTLNDTHRIPLEEEGDDTTLFSIPNGHSLSDTGHPDTDPIAENTIVDSEI